MKTLLLLLAAAGLVLAEPAVSLRVRFGLTHSAPSAWDGTVSARNGEILSLRNWNPHPSE
ncbi:MAG: hypothetical protein GY953_29835, partial [bacterium]|nr:hypothetical protein [bacterium]